MAQPDYTCISEIDRPAEILRPKPQKIGVLTFHRCVNYGAYWQARCLLEHLQSLGHEVSLLDHVSGRSIREEWPRLMRPTRPAPKIDVARSINKIFKFLTAQQRLPRTRTFNPARPPKFEDLDCIVVGSDEVWNIVHPWYGNEPLFFGEGLRPRRLISYAPSFGNYDSTQGLPSEWTRRLQRFDRISVRDHNSARIVRDALKTEPAMVLDPCLQFFPEVFAQTVRRNQSDYLLVYATQLDQTFVREATQWARQRGLRIVSVGYRQAWADVSFPAAGPEEFLRCFQNAQAVVTSFFHGCVFSLRFGRPFLVNIPDYRANKVKGLLNVVGAPQRLHDIAKPLRPDLLEEPLSSDVLSNIARHRRASLVYLDEALVA